MLPEMVAFLLLIIYYRVQSFDDAMTKHDVGKSLEINYEGPHTLTCERRKVNAQSKNQFTVIRNI